MSEKRGRGQPRKYLRIDEWQRFLNNDWRHMNWKVNGLLGFALTILATLIACLVLQVIGL